MKHPYKYMIILFKNKKRYKFFYGCQTAKSALRRWRDLKGEVQPRFTVEYMGRHETARNEKVKYELVLLFPANKHATSKVYIADHLGRNIEAKSSNEKYRIKEIFPYWKEELVYSHQSNTHIRYHQLINELTSITEISQLFKLNTKIVAQIDEKFQFYSTKNLSDSERLFDLVKDDLIKQRKGNFIFVKDVTTQQRTMLYNLLTQKGYKRQWLFKHYSY
jgi:hypothetical protein